MCWIGVHESKCGLLSSPDSYSRLNQNFFKYVMHSQVINDANNYPHVAFYAKTDLKPGQELTFDYR